MRFRKFSRIVSLGIVVQSIYCVYTLRRLNFQQDSHLATSTSNISFEEKPVSLKYNLLEAAGCFTILLYVFLGMAIVCDDYMVPAIERLCEAWNIPDEAAGASFLAFGSAAPEILINVVATSYGKVEASLSAIFGSAIIAYGLIPALCAFVSPGSTFSLKLGPLLRDAGGFIFSLITLGFFMRDSVITFWESFILCIEFVVYMIIVYIPVICGRDKSVPETTAEYNQISERAHVLLGGMFKEAVTPSHPDGALLLEHQIQPQQQSCLVSSCTCIMTVLNAPFYFVFGWTLPDCQEDSKYYKWYPVTVVFSIGWVALFSEAALFLTRRLSDDLNISRALSGVTLLALGSQVPDTIASIAMARSGMADGAVSNAIGSQIINITIGSGLPFLVYNAIYGPLAVPSSSVNFIAAVLTIVISLYLLCSLRGLCFNTVIGLTKGAGVFMIITYIAANVAMVVYTYI